MNIKKTLDPLKSPLESVSDDILSDLLAERGLDENQRKAVFSDENTVVSAGAGSGKTTVLSYRFLRLVLERKAHVDQILTLTFTRKAAAEMQERIQKMLFDHQDHPVISEEIQQIDRAAISTIDSFCAGIVRSDCRRYGIAPDFRQDEEKSFKAASDTAMMFIHENLEHPAMNRLLSIHSFSRVFNDLLVPLATAHMCPSRPLDFIKSFQSYLDKVRNDLITLTLTMESSARLILDIPQRTKTISAAHQWGKGMLSDLLPMILEERYPEAFLRAQTLGLPRTPSSSAKEDMALLKSEILAVKEIWKPLLLALHLLGSREEIGETYQLLGNFQEICLQQKRTSGILTFSDTTAMAVDILLTNSELCSWYRSRFTHIMIDEFQDNNDLQRQLLFILAGRNDTGTDSVPGPEELSPDKLFFVGDEKQSIYRFRGADVSVFKSLSSQLTAAGGRSVSLQTNYRSEPGLIHTFNEIYPRIMENADQPYEAGFEPLLTRGANPGVDPTFTLCLKVTSETEEENGESDIEQTADYSEPSSKPEEPVHSDEAEAWYAAEKIRTIVLRESLTLPDPATGKTRPAGYSDIAVLLHSMSNQMRYERAFRAFGIPFVTQSVRALFLEAPVNDIYQILQLTVYPEDRQAFAALLRSPWAKIGDDLLVFLFDELHQNREIPAFDDRLDSVFDILSDKFASTNDEYKTYIEASWKRYRQVKALYRQLEEMTHSACLAELVEYLWYEGGYRYVVLRHPDQHRYLEYFDYLRELAFLADSRQESLSEFLDFIRAKLGNNEKISEIELMREQQEGVQIMSIHKSKGLEFPVVFLVNTGNRGRHDHEPMLFYPDGSDYPAVSATEGVVLEKGK
ncbi:MAG: UvrD-helicase domain-containing protein, partial [Spirochaetales bacterium]|nr:UvrD-helicase domain-containing protein [Spirochaetales bacterium]